MIPPSSLLSYLRGSLVDPQMRALNEALLRARVPRAGGRPGCPAPPFKLSRARILKRMHHTVPATWLPSPIERLLTEHFYRRSMVPDVPVTVAAVSSARFSPLSCALDLAAVLFTPTPNSLSSRITARMRILWNEGPHGDCQPPTPLCLLGTDPCANCVLCVSTEFYSDE